jgi:ABC-type antimicrobial peptide transport system permease subunit
MNLLVRTSGSADAAALGVRAAVRAVDPELVAEDLRTLRAEFHMRLWQRRLFATLLGVCAILAFVIAAVGLYGVMAYSVAQRTREIGIRMALGAQAIAVQQMVVRQALSLTITGIVIGLAGAFALTRFMTNVILGVSPTDPPTFFVVTLMLALSGLVAAWVPAWRAVRVDPVVALRHE